MYPVPLQPADILIIPLLFLKPGTTTRYARSLCFGCYTYLTYEPRTCLKNHVLVDAFDTLDPSPVEQQRAHSLDI